MIGCDIAYIKRFEKFIDDEKFLKKYFTLGEQKYLSTKTNKAQTLAGLYAVKEAVLKAFSLGIGNGISLLDIEIEHNDFGAPVVNTNDKIKCILDKQNKKNISISISHDGDYAMAVCLVE